MACWVLAIVAVLALVLFGLHRKDTRCEAACAPEPGRTMGRDGICFCRVRLPDGRAIWSPPEGR